MRNSAGNSSQYSFSIVPNATLPRCKLRRPSTHKTTFNSDYLIPMYWDEVVPGDTFKVDVSCVARLTTLLAPIMDNLYMDWQFFYVPYRLVWSHFDNLLGVRDNPDDSIDYRFPCVKAPSGGIAAQSIGDYFGLPIGVQWRTGDTSEDRDVQALPFRAYNLIWNEWYRDENLQDSVTVYKGDDDENIADYQLLKRGKRKDYFTSALPSPQKGPAMAISLGNSAPVIGNGLALGVTDGTTTAGLADRAGGASDAHLASFAVDAYGVAVGGTRGNTFISSGKPVGVTTDPAKSGLVADLSTIEPVTINALRQAFQLQKLLERDQRGGTRITELIRSHFNCIVPDLRVQRPEFLGSFTIPINIHTVTQTSESGTTPQGSLTGVGTVNGVHRAFTKSFVEHGIIIGLASVRADLTYQQGIPRKFSRSTRYSIYWPVLAHLGEQDIKLKEIYATGTSADATVFGYQERWSEYKFGFNQVSGQLRSTYSQSLDFWHLAQNFASAPTLNGTFISENVPLDRVLALNSETAPQFICDTLFDVTCARPMPLYDVPGFVDHF